MSILCVWPPRELEAELLVQSEAKPVIKLGNQRRMRAVA